jgi:carbonic anhydrase
MSTSTDAVPDSAPDSLLDGAPPVEGNDAGGSGDTDKGAAGKGKSQGAAKGRISALQPYLPGRREALFLAGGVLLGGAVGAGGLLASHREPAVPERDDEAELTARDGKERLEAGNARYVAGAPLHPDQSVERRALLAEGQRPFAAILSCADSRVPPETLFDQGIGDLFVARSAGQVIDRAVMGSLQYGVEHLGVSLLVVLGHSRCGAVKATVEYLDSEEATGTDIDALVTAILPAVKEAEELGAEGDDLLDTSININVERIVEKLKGAPLIAEAASLRTIKVVGAVYDLATGEVDWL